MQIIALAVFTVLGLYALPRLTLTVLGFVVNPFLGVAVGLMALLSLGVK